ncbi:enoyl-CoA hydratase-related protein [Actinomadura livida]|uniref:Enoyl-CoA hydratase n=1 Tax=Actinomadura livida TaxID=79909 RepID=A0A7W7MZK5_9ACTN|nr:MULTISPECIES: enoyl-CoA hydratase-related protein [Actinomadura]MBB4775940.1 enoyl-CoA hydratase [Actinomadura catellatispora]GGU16623.1 enoyl-CoA hydratase [Actinomadura livida]
MTAYETLLIEEPAPGVRRVTLDRPPVNAVNRVMIRELTEAFGAVADDRDVRAVVLAAAGSRAFCGGIDLKEPPPDPAERTPSELLNPGLAWRTAQHAVRHCPVPVICAIEGAAIGAGFGLIAMCDVLIASTRAAFGLTEINVGLLGGASKALHMVGPYKARSMMFTGELLDAAEMHRLGVVEKVVEPGLAGDEAVRTAASLAGKSPIAMRLLKESILRIEGDAIEQNYRTEWDYTNRLGQFADSREARAAYLEKRAPSWTWT